MAVPRSSGLSPAALCCCASYFDSASKRSESISNDLRWKYYSFAVQEEAMRSAQFLRLKSGNHFKYLNE